MNLYLQQKKIVFYLMNLYIIIGILFYIISMIMLPPDRRGNFDPSLVLISFYFLISLSPLLLIIYLNFIKSKTLIEYILSICILFFIKYIFDILQHKVILIQNYIYLYISFNKKEYYEIFNEIISSLFLIVSFFFFSLTLKFTAGKIKFCELPIFEDNFLKFQKRIILIFFIVPFVVMILLLIPSFIMGRDNINPELFILLATFQIPNILQLYLNIHKSNNTYEKHIGFLIFCINLVTSFVYIAMANDEEYAPINIYFSMYCVFSPILLAIGLKYLITRELPFKYSMIKNRSFFK